MADSGQDRLGPAELETLARFVGIATDSGHLEAVGPAIRRYHELALRMRELDLIQEQPAVAFRAGKERVR
ncbi:MAG: hypothetical protein ACYC1C_10575 [Chloroflexota bacterium]